jgi:hypothetical protein
MEATVSQMPLNEVQTFLLQAFSRMKSEEERDDVQALLLDYYRKKVDAHINSVSLNNEKIEEILQSHYRTPYK